MENLVSIIFPTKSDKVNFKKGVLIPKNSALTKINIQKAISIPIQIIAKPNSRIKISGFPKIKKIEKIENFFILHEKPDPPPEKNHPQEANPDSFDDFPADDYGFTLSEDDFNLIESSEGDSHASPYFEDYGIENFYALSTERSATVQCNPTDVIIGSDVSLKDASIYPDDLKMYFFSCLADKESPLHASNLSSILISKVLKNLEFAKAKRKCECR